jgi:hypothetical protein
MPTVIARARLARPWSGTGRQYALDCLSGFAGMVAVLSSALLPRPPLPPVVAQAHETGDAQDAAAIAARAVLSERVRYKGDEVLIAVYGGAPYTYASDVRIAQQGTDMTVHGVDWQGKPFDDPIYYGARVARWFVNSSLGGMVDFTHSKAYAPLDQKAKLSGNKEGQLLPPEATIGDLFHKLEFTHGHNMLT